MKGELAYRKLHERDDYRINAQNLLKLHQHGRPIIGLNCAFAWASTPHGHAFWQEQHDARALNPEGVRVLQLIAYGEDYEPTDDSYPLVEGIMMEDGDV